MIKIELFSRSHKLQETHFIPGVIRATTPPERAITTLLLRQLRRCSPEPLANLPALRVVTVETNSGLHCIGGRRITR